MRIPYMTRATWLGKVQAWKNIREALAYSTIPARRCLENAAMGEWRVLPAQVRPGALYTSTTCIPDRYSHKFWIRKIETAKSGVTINVTCDIDKMGWHRYSISTVLFVLEYTGCNFIFMTFYIVISNCLT